MYPPELIRRLWVASNCVLLHSLFIQYVHQHNSCYSVAWMAADQGMPGQLPGHTQAQQCYNMHCELVSCFSELSAQVDTHVCSHLCSVVDITHTHSHTEYLNIHTYNWLFKLLAIGPPNVCNIQIPPLPFPEMFRRPDIHIHNIHTNLFKHAHTHTHTSHTHTVKWTSSSKLATVHSPFVRWRQTALGS